MVYDAILQRSARVHTSLEEAVAWAVRLPAGFCFLVSRTSGRPIEPAFDFLASEYLGGRRFSNLRCQKNTIKAVVDDLLDFHNFLDAREIEVNAANADTLEDYLETMTALESPTTGAAYQPATVVRRRSSVVRFLKHCQDNGLLRYRFEVTSVSTPFGIKTAIAGRIKAPSVGPIDRLVQAINPLILNPLMDEIGSSPVSVAVDGSIMQTGRISPERLGAELCLQAGLRREEVCELRASEVTKADIEGRDPLTSVAIKVLGKGNKERMVPVPVWLLESLKLYTKDHREPAVNAALESGQLARDHDRLFVIETQRKGDLGNPVTPRRFNKVFAAARDRLAMKLAAIPESRAMLERLQNTRVTVHALRHTFALMTFIRRRESGDADPAKYVQAVLGHAYKSTTESIYLRSAQVYESELHEVMNVIARKGMNLRDHQLTKLETS